LAGTTNLYRGMIIKYNNDPHILIEKEFYSPGKGGAFNRCKLRNIKTGKILSQIFKSGEKVDEIEVVSKTMQFIYKEADNAVFMDPKTFEQVSIDISIIPGETDFLHEEGKYIISFFEERAIYVEIPQKIKLQVIDTPEAVRGDTATNALKEATLETGAKVKVPLFIKRGDFILVNTDSYSYFSKA